MPCIFDIKPEDRHCRYCTATICDERQPKSVETFTTNKIDDMTDKEAIKYLQQLYPNGGHCWLDEQRIEAIGMAIQALQEEPVSTRDKLRALSDGKQHLGWLDDAREVEEEPVSEGKDIFDNCLKSEEKFILPQKISGNINCENCLYSSACALGDIQACIIDKPVSEDLGEYINELSKQFPEVSFAKLSRIAVRVSRWQEKQTVINACELLRANLCEYFDASREDYDNFIDDFRKVMED